MVRADFQTKKKSSAASSPCSVGKCATFFGLAYRENHKHAFVGLLFTPFAPICLPPPPPFHSWQTCIDRPVPKLFTPFGVQALLEWPCGRHHLGGDSCLPCGKISIETDLRFVGHQLYRAQVLSSQQKTGLGAQRAAQLLQHFAQGRARTLELGSGIRAGGPFLVKSGKQLATCTLPPQVFPNVPSSARPRTPAAAPTPDELRAGLEKGIPLEVAVWMAPGFAQPTLKRQHIKQKTGCRSFNEPESFLSDSKQTRAS